MVTTKSSLFPRKKKYNIKKCRRQHDWASTWKKTLLFPIYSLSLQKEYTMTYKVFFFFLFLFFTIFSLSLLIFFYITLEKLKRRREEKKSCGLTKLPDFCCVTCTICWPLLLLLLLLLMLNSSQPWCWTPLAVKDGPTIWPYWENIYF